MAIDIQNLFWGIGQPIFGAMAERIGDRKAIIFGALLYATGIVATAYTTTPFMMQSMEVLVGFGIAGTGFGFILAVSDARPRTKTALWRWPSPPLPDRRTKSSAHR